MLSVVFVSAVTSVPAVEQMRPRPTDGLAGLGLVRPDWSDHLFSGKVRGVDCMGAGLSGISA